MPISAKLLRQMMFDEGVIVSHKIEDANDEQEKFKMYYEYREPVKKIPSHRMLAIRRGENENVLYFQIELDRRAPIDLPEIAGSCKTPGDWTPHLELAAEDCLEAPAQLSIQSEIRLELKKRADIEAIKVFRENLENLLLSPPAGQLARSRHRSRHSHRLQDRSGGRYRQISRTRVIYPHEPKNDVAGSERTLERADRQTRVRAIAIGNGTASRETDALVRDFLKAEKLDGVFSVTVNESGASIYSASDIARQEFPDLDLTVRGAISIARRLAGSARRTGQDRSQVDRRGPVPA